MFLNLSFDPFKQIFSKILRSFGLPVGPNKYHITYADPSYEFSSTCLWVVAMISPTGTAMSHIRQFIQTIEPFLHPSNMGWWQRSLNGAISQLCSMFTARVHLERLVQSSLSLSNVYLQRQCLNVKDYLTMHFVGLPRHITSRHSTSRVESVKRWASSCCHNVRVISHNFVRIHRLI